MVNESDLFRLGHISECVDKILKLVELINTLENLEKNWIKQDAMIRNFEIICEASNHISEELKDKYPVINWNEIENYIQNEYFEIDLDNVWQTAIDDIPKLKELISIIILDIRQ